MIPRTLNSKCTRNHSSFNANGLFVPHSPLLDHSPSTLDRETVHSKKEAKNKALEILNIKLNEAKRNK